MATRSRRLAAAPAAALLILAACAALTACGSKSGGEGSPPPAGVAVGPAGGTFDLGNGVTIVVPPGALAQETRITLTTATAPAAALSPMYQFRPEGLTFQKPITVTMPLPAAAPAGTSVLWTQYGDPAVWEYLGGTAAGSTIAVQVAHFSNAWLAVAYPPMDRPLEIFATMVPMPVGYSPRCGGLGGARPPAGKPTAAVGPGRVTVGWDVAPDATSYYVFFTDDGTPPGACNRKPGAPNEYTCSGGVVLVSGWQSTEVTVTGLKPLRAFTFRIASYSTRSDPPALGWCGSSVVATPTMAAPTGLTATGAANAVVGTFDPVPGADSYWVEWNNAAFDPTDPGYVPAHRLQVTPSAPGPVHYAILDLTAGTRIYAAVRGATADGEGPASSVADAVVQGQGTYVVQPLFPSAGREWNVYVKNNRQRRVEADGTPCEKAAWVGGSSFGYTGDSGGYGSCIHAGEMRLLTVPDLGNCTGVTAEDDQQALRWICDDSAGTGVARIVSVGLNEGKGLRDLLDLGVPAWRPMTLIVKSGSTEIVRTQPAAWWSNPVALTDGAMNRPGTVYVLSTPASGELISADGVAVVTNLPDALRDSGMGVFQLSGTGNSFVWVEGHFLAIQLTDLSHSVLRGIKVGGYTAYPFQIIGHSAANRIEEVTAVGAQMVSLEIDASVISRIDVASTGVGNSLGGVQILGSNNVVSEAVTCCGTRVGVGSPGGFDGAGAPSGGHAVLGMTLANLSELLVRGQNVTLARVASAERSLVMGPQVPGQGGFRQVQMIDLPDWTPTFVGPLPNADEANLTRGNPKALTANDLPTDWVRFGTLQRGWGFDPSSAATGSARASLACVLNAFGSQGIPFCQIWDFAVLATDTQLRNVAQDTVVTHTWFYPKQGLADPFPASQADCAKLAFGSTFVTDHCESTFLADAVEIESPGRGNGNGLCDSGEDCLAAPNVGGYQGHGPVVRRGLFATNPPTFTAILWGRSTNGYPRSP